MAETIDSLLVNLGLETDEQSFSDAEQSFKQLESKALQFGATIGAGLGLNELTFGFAEAVDQINNLSEEFEGFGVSPQLISNLQTVLEIIGQDGSDAEGVIRNLASLVEETDWGNISEMALAKGFDIKGIQQAETAGQALSALNEQLAGMDQEQARRVAGEFGIGQAGLELLRLPDLGQRMSEAGQLNPLTGAQTQAARDFQKGFAEVTSAIDGLSRILSEQFVGDLGESMSTMADILAENRDYIREFVETYGPYLADAAKGIGVLVGIQAARAGLGILSKIPGSTLLAAGAGIGISAVLDEDTQKQIEESTNRRNVEQIQDRIERLNQQIGVAQEAGLKDQADNLREERQKWNQMLKERMPPGDFGRIPLVGPDQPLSAQGAGGGNLTVNVDARGATSPDEVRRQAERGANSAIARASENALLDLRTNVS